MMKLSYGNIMLGACQTRLGEKGGLVHY